MSKPPVSQPPTPTQSTLDAILRQAIRRAALPATRAWLRKMLREGEGGGRADRRRNSRVKR